MKLMPKITKIRKTDLFKKFSTVISQNKLHLFLLFLFFPFLILSILTYEGLIFEEKVEYVSYEIGKLQSSIQGHGYDERDYDMFVYFESKGTFIVGRKIHVSVDLIPNRNLTEFEKSELKLAFPGSMDFPIPKYKRSRVLLTYLYLNFNNDSVAHGEKDIVYFMPELSGESSVIPVKTNGKYSYNLFVNGIPQTTDRIYRFNPVLYLAPMETELQLKNNRLILVLTFFVVYLTIVQIVISLYGKKKN